MYKNIITGHVSQDSGSYNSIIKVALEREYKDTIHVDVHGSEELQPVPGSTQHGVREQTAIQTQYQALDRRGHAERRQQHDTGSYVLYHLTSECILQIPVHLHVICVFLCNQSKG